MRRELQLPAAPASETYPLPGAVSRGPAAPAPPAPSEGRTACRRAAAAWVAGSRGLRAGVTSRSTRSGAGVPEAEATGGGAGVAEGRSGVTSAGAGPRALPRKLKSLWCSAASRPTASLAACLGRPGPGELGAFGAAFGAPSRLPWGGRGEPCPERERNGRRVGLGGVLSARVFQGRGEGVPRASPRPGRRAPSADRRAGRRGAAADLAASPGLSVWKVNRPLDVVQANGRVPSGNGPAGRACTARERQRGRSWRPRPFARRSAGKVHAGVFTQLRRDLSFTECVPRQFSPEWKKTPFRGLVRDVGG